ncbi:hypothetical protein [Mucilaginibacter sp.]|uniref:hypothetical protein n=1 Tax=Mucilaginibacter sp. TaxID=1882438 RepID=UPI003264A57C
MDVIKIKMPESPPFAEGITPTGDDLVWVWGIDDGILRKCKISDLPFSTSGGGGGGADPGITNPNPFMVFTSSDNYAYDADTNTVIVSDVRLKGRVQYPVYVSQAGGGEVNPAIIGYEEIDPEDDTKGRFTLTGFQLDEGAHLTVIVPVNQNAGDSSLTQLTADVAELKRMMAPFTPTITGANGGKAWYTGDLNDLAGTGWQECVEMRGYFPMHRVEGDADFGGNVGTDGGAKGVKMTLGNLISHVHNFIKIQTQGSGVTSGYVRGAVQGNDTKATEATGSADPDPIKTIPPFLIGHWIEYVGI